MANPEHLKILKQGIASWANWREKNLTIGPDLYEADLKNMNLSGVDLTWANLGKANLEGANLRDIDLTEANLEEANLKDTNLSKAKLYKATLSKANLYRANLSGVNLYKANLDGADLRGAKIIGANLAEASLEGANLIDSNLSEANLEGANLSWANLYGGLLHKAVLFRTSLKGANLSHANLCGANLKGTNLMMTTFVQTRLEGADISNSHIYGISAWDLKTNKYTEQLGLVVTDKDGPIITVDNLEVAQFVYLMLNRKKLRDVIDTITSKSVLILGRFTPERKAVLDAMANELRKHNLLPIIFDFERASSRDFTETIKTLAGMSLFVIADITNPKSAPLELQATVPDYQIPFVPILQKGEKPFSMLSDLQKKYQWVLPLLKYQSLTVLIEVFEKAIIHEAFGMHKKLLKLKAEKMETRSAEDYLVESD